MSQSDNENDSSQPRRSQRERKQATVFVSGGSQKRKRTDVDTGDEGDDDMNGAESPDEDNGREEEEGEEYHAPKAKKASASPDKVKGKAKATSTVKRPRTAKAAATPKVPVTGARRGRKPKVTGDTFDADKVAKEAKINNDNVLFNAIINPSAALQSTVEDFLESLTESPGPAQAELVNCILRCCGCNDTVDADAAVDYDGVVDALDNFTEALKQDNSPPYPLTSKLPYLKKFHKGLSEFLERLIKSSAELGSLYSSDLMLTIKNWVVPMSSSQLRSFRHTSTVIALEVESALCDVAAAVQKEAEIVGKQKQGESNKKKGAGSAREKDLNSRANEIRERREKLKDYIDEIVNTVFVHRYRDLDPTIRTECVRALGLWFKKYPSQFLKSDYLRYVGWVLSDQNTHVRLEAVKSLVFPYSKSEFHLTLDTFTERFIPRLVQMATADTELSVRVAVIQVLAAMDEIGCLQDHHEEERGALCLLVFDEEMKVRKAVSRFVRAIWEQMVQERLVGKRNAKGKEKERAGVKALGTLLVKLGKALDKVVDSPGDSDEDEAAERGLSKDARVREVQALMKSDPKTRTALVVQSLWDEVDPVSDWESLLDVLLLDHSAAGEGTSGSGARGKKKKGKQQVNGDADGELDGDGDTDSVVDEAWRLDEVEEAVLLEVLVASLRQAKSIAQQTAKKGEEDSTSSNITRALIKALPRLFAKHQTDETRIAEVLAIPKLMDLDLYLEMRMMTAYASLWSDITKQFTSHSSPKVLAQSVDTILFMLHCTALSNTNSTKVLELEDELATSLRDAIGGRDELEIASFDEDEVRNLSVICTRLKTLAGYRDMTGWMEEDEGGKQSSAWDIINALAERGKLGYKEEEAMVAQCLDLLACHTMWKAKYLTAEPHPSPEEVRFREVFLEQREALLQKLVEYAVGTQSNTADGVRRAAFMNLMNLHVLFAPEVVDPSAPSPSPISAMRALTLDDEVQYRCAGFVQAEIERFAEELAENAQGNDQDQAADEDEDDESQHSDSEEDEPAPSKKKKGTKAKKGKKGAKERELKTPPATRAFLEREYAFIRLVSTFLQAARIGAVHMRHCAIVLTHYGRLGHAVDSFSKAVSEVLKDEGLYKDNGAGVHDVITEALQESFTLLLDGVVSSEGPSVALAKMLSGCLWIRGAQLSVVRRLDSQHIINIHTTLLTWIGKRLALYEANKNKKGRNTAVLFFKVLHPLVAPVQSRDALKIKAHMDQILDQAKVEIAPTSQVWEPQRAYEKRLANVMSKTKGGAKSRAAKSKDIVTTDDEDIVDDMLDANGEPNAPKPSRPRPRAVRRSKRLTDSEPEPEPVEASEPESDQALSPPPQSEPPEDNVGATNEVVAPPTPITAPRRPRAKPKAKENTQQKTPTKKRTRGQARETDEEDDGEGEDAGDAEATPRASRKRRRSPLDEEEGEPTGNGQGEQEQELSRHSTPQALPSPASSTGEIKVRRKRARH